MELEANGTMSNILPCRSGHNLLDPLLPILLCIAPNSFAQNQGFPAKDNALLHAGDLSLNIEVANQHFGGLHIHDALSSRTIDIPAAFILVLKDKTVLRSTDMQVTRISDLIAATDTHQSLRISHEDTRSSTSSCWSFATLQFLARLQWCVIVRPGPAYDGYALSGPKYFQQVSGHLSHDDRSVQRQSVQVRRNWQRG
jgi:hypothetical protein